MRRRLIETGLLAAIGSGVVASSQLSWSPPPIGAATTVGGGVLLFAFASRPPWLTLTIGAALGWAFGVALHVRSHVVEDRVGEPDAFVGHVLSDAGLGAAIGGLGLAIGVAVLIAVRARRG
ncbi:MAG: hypothetical protein KJO43_15465 [Phycisphaerae bacterium]|nr:hypothetical protein [Phycisphaerae bacterium]